MLNPFKCASCQGSGLWPAHMAPCPSCGGSGWDADFILYAAVALLYALWVAAVVVTYALG